jgi:hypothetical protein
LADLVDSEAVPEDLAEGVSAAVAVVAEEQVGSFCKQIQIFAII